MNHKGIIPYQYLRFVKAYVEYVKWLRQQSYVNHYSIELFSYTYWEWTRGVNFFLRNKRRFLIHMKNITKKEKIIIHENGKGADNVNVLFSLFKGLGKKVLKFRFNPLKLVTVCKDYVQIEKVDDIAEASVASIETKAEVKDNLWWYHINESVGHKVSYHKHHWYKVHIGDIIYENEGFNKVTGHVEIVEGRYYDVEQQTFYIKIIEAISPYGVTHGLLDDQRLEDRQGVVLRMPDLSHDEIITLINYANSKVGQKYVLRFTAGTDKGEWYCSELVWQAFKNIGRDILDRKGDLLNLKSISDGVNMAHDIAKMKKKYDLSKNINTLDLVSIAGGMVVPHELVDSSKFTKVVI